jgi:hypothetical protein
MSLLSTSGIRLLAALTLAAPALIPGAAVAQTPLPQAHRMAKVMPSGVMIPSASNVSNLLHFDRPVAVPFRPVIDGEALSNPEYATLKQLIGTGEGVRKDSGGDIQPMVSPFYVTAGLNMTDTAGWYPPDDSLAVGPTTAVQPVNGTVRIYKRTAAGLTVFSTTDMSAFMNWSTTDPFDCRVIYDKVGGHFIVSYSSFQYKDSTATSHQYFLLAVSQTSDATGAWWTYNFDTIPFVSYNPNFVAGDVPFFDFPDIGFDANNFYVTANIFGNDAYYGASLFAFDLNSLETGNGLAGYYWNGLNSTLTPPYVASEGTGGFHYFLYPIEYSGSIGYYGLVGNVNTTAPILSGPYAVTVPYYTPPSAAIQPGGATLDTIDGRFQDKITQVGDTIYAVHAVGDSGYSDVQAYAFNAYTATLLQTTTLYASTLSFDFNPSITANAAGTAVVNWDYTIPAPRNGKGTYESVRAQILSAAKKPWPAHAAGTAVPGAISNYASTLFRNGDYSMTVLDPINSKLFWGVNQAVLDAGSHWNTYLFSYKTP